MLTKEVKQGKRDLWGNELQKVGPFHVGLATWVGTERLVIFPIFFLSFCASSFSRGLCLYLQEPTLCDCKGTHSPTATSITYKVLQIFASMVWSNIQLMIDLKCFKFSYSFFYETSNKFSRDLDTCVTIRTTLIPVGCMGPFDSLPFSVHSLPFWGIFFHRILPAVWGSISFLFVHTS